MNRLEQRLLAGESVGRRGAVLFKSTLFALLVSVNGGTHHLSGLSSV